MIDNTKSNKPKINATLYHFYSIGSSYYQLVSFTDMKEETLTPKVMILNVTLKKTDVDSFPCDKD